MTSNTDFDTEIKKYELEKIKLEVKALKKSVWISPQLWIPVILVITVAIIDVFFLKKGSIAQLAYDKKVFDEQLSHYQADTLAYQKNLSNLEKQIQKFEVDQNKLEVSKNKLEHRDSLLDSFEIKLDGRKIELDARNKKLINAQKSFRKEKIQSDKLIIQMAQSEREAKEKLQEAQGDLEQAEDSFAVKKTELSKTIKQLTAAKEKLKIAKIRQQFLNLKKNVMDLYLTNLPPIAQRKLSYSANRKPDDIKSDIKANFKGIEKVQYKFKLSHQKLYDMLKENIGKFEKSGKKRIIKNANTLLGDIFPIIDQLDEELAPK